MRVTIDATPLLLRSAGVKGYLYHWIRSLQTLSEDERVEVYPPMGRLGPLDHEHSLAGPWTTRFNLLLVHAARQVPLLRLLRTDVFHANLLTRMPPSRSLITSTIHDMTAWKTPQFHTTRNVALDRRFGDRILKKADGLIAVSEHSRRDAIEILGVSPDKIRTIHSGVAAPYFDATPNKAAKPYVLCVGTIEPRKNLDRLLDAWAALPRDYRDRWDLVVAGPTGWQSEATAARLKKEVKWLGYVDESDMPGLTAGADLLAYPSLYEGFGFPVAQAMASGVPVLTSNVSSLPEVTGPGGLLVDPMSVGEIGSSLRRLLDSPELRSSLGRAGRLHAERYRWERCGRESLDFFHSLL